MNYICYYQSPLGKITLVSDSENLAGLWFEKNPYYDTENLHAAFSDTLPVFKQTGHWLDIYFSGQNPDFTPPLYIKDTDFRKSIFKILLKIPYGKTSTYGDISKEIANERGLKMMSSQAVGGAIAHNPISIIIPCHRVLGANGNLTGYSGGLERKIKLLELENANI